MRYAHGILIMFLVKDEFEKGTQNHETKNENKKNKNSFIVSTVQVFYERKFDQKECEKRFGMKINHFIEINNIFFTANVKNR